MNRSTVVTFLIVLSILAAFYFRNSYIDVQGYGTVQVNRWTGLATPVIQNLATSAKRNSSTFRVVKGDELKTFVFDCSPMPEPRQGEPFKLRIFNGSPARLVSVSIAMTAKPKDNTPIVIDVGSRDVDIGPYSWGQFDGYLSGQGLLPHLTRNNDKPVDLSDLIAETKLDVVSVRLSD